MNSQRRNFRKKFSRREQKTQLQINESQELIRENENYNKRIRLDLQHLNHGTIQSAKRANTLIVDSIDGLAHINVDSHSEIYCDSNLSRAENISSANIRSSDKDNQQNYESDTPDPIESDESDSDELLDFQKSPSEICAEKLVKLAMKHHPTQAFMSDLCSELRTFFPGLPKTARTLLQIPSTCDVRTMENGEFFYTGVKFHLDKILATQNNLELTSLSLSFNIDGIPIYKSKNISFTPILCMIKELSHPPFVVALHCGSAKPPLGEYLDEFINEMLILLDNYEFNDKKINLSIHSFICDAPATNFVRCTAKYNGYFGCGKCDQEGVWASGRVVFDKMNAKLRTHHDFKNRTQKSHHDDLVCPLLKIEQLDIVQSFPLDYMHLVLLGVMRKFLYIWRKGTKYISSFFTAAHIEILDSKLASIRKYWPSDFNRKPRSITELERWKATELRQFLLYVGPVVLKDVLNTREYHHFLLLSLAITILIRKDARKYIDMAEGYLRQFVTKSKEIYGVESLVSNVHGLIHLADDARRKGVLDEFCAFPFENLLGQLKRLLKKSNHPIQQAYKKLYVANRLSSEVVASEKALVKIIKGSVLTPLSYGNEFSGTHSKSVEFKGMKLACNTKDQFVYDKHKRVIKIERLIVGENCDKLFIVGRCLARIEPLYFYPQSSDKFKIFSTRSLDRLRNEVIIFNANEMFSKAAIVKNNEKFAIFPLHPNS